MSDRVIVFSSDPGRIRAELPVTLPRPRDHANTVFRQIVDEVYTQITTQPGREPGKRGTPTQAVGITYRLPPASIQQLMALLDTLTGAPFNGRADLPHLAEELSLSVDDLFPLIEAFQLMGLAQVGGGDIEATAAGRALAEADMLKRKQLFAEHLLRSVPLIAHIRRVLDERPGHTAPSGRFLSELEDHLSEEDASEVFETVVNWARYAELFAYDYDSGVLSLENP